MGRWMNELIQKGVFASNELVSVDDSKDKEELQINQWLRDFVLEEDGALVLTSMSSSIGGEPETTTITNGFPRDGILYDEEDVVTHTTVVLDRFELLGLDTLTLFSPFQVVGDYTLETNLAWKFLALELDVTVTVRPSTRPDSVIETTETSTSNIIVEQVKLMLGVDGLTAGASLMAALNRTALEHNVRLGSLLKSNTAAIDCLLSTIVDLKFSTLSVQVTNDVLTPSIEGLVSPGLDRLVSQALDASSLIYEDVLMEAASLYFQNELRPMLTQKILHEYLLQRSTTEVATTTSTTAGVGAIARGNNSTRNGRTCHPWTTEGLEDNKLVDFRELFLPTDEAIALGGSGSATHGDLFSGMIMPYINEEVMKADALNTQWIRGITKEQSGTEGVLEFNDVVRYLETSSASPLYDGLDFRISKITIANLDTVAEPLEFLQPTDNGSVLQNRFAMHLVPDDAGRFRFLNVTVRVHLGIDGEKSPFQMTNVVDFSISVPTTTFSVAILADLKERSFLEFPLKDITNPYCWLAAFGSNNDDDKAAERAKNLGIVSLSFDFLTFYLDSKCITATSPGCDSMSEVIYRLEDADFVPSFRNSIIGLVENVALSLWDALDVSEWINEAPSHCPHSDSFDAQAIVEPTLFEIPDVSGMSRNSSETILALGIVGLQTAIVVSAKNHLLLAVDDQEPLAPDEQLSSPSSSVESTATIFPEGNEIIDWTNLSDIGSWVGIAFDDFRNFLSTDVVVVASSESDIYTRELSSELTPQINNIVREYVLDESGSLELELNDDDSSFATLGVTFSISKVRIRGLDTISTIEPLVVLDSHKMGTKLQLEELTVTFECNLATMNNTATDQIELVYKAKDIGLDIDTKIALNMTEFGKIQVGSLFDISQITNCMWKGVQALEIIKLNLVLRELQTPTIDDESSFSPELKVAVNRILESLRNNYQNEIIQAIPLIARSTMRDVINTLIPGILESKAKKCPTPPEFPSDGLVDFRDFFLPAEESEKLGGSAVSHYGYLFQTVYDFLDKEVMQTGASNRPVLNDWLKTMTKRQSNTTGTIKVMGSAVDTESVVQIAGLRADLRIEVSDVLIENLDSVGDPLYLFQPVNGKANVLDNKLSFGVDNKPLRFQGTLFLSLDDGAEMKIRNEIYVSFLIKDVTVQTSILLQVLENSVSSFPLEDFSDMYCWAATILPKSDEETIFEGIQLFDHKYSTGEFDMDISCKSCTSPDFDKLLLSLYEPQDITAAIREQTSSLTESGFVQTFLNDIVVESKKRCPHRPEFDPNYESIDTADSSLLSDAAFGLVSSEQKQNSMYFSIANSVVASCLIIAGLLGKVILARRNKEWIQSLSNEGQFFFDCQREKEHAIEDWLNDNTTSLFTSSSIPKSIRWGVPILILLNVGLYLGGHFGLLSVVNLDIILAGQSFTIKKFLEFRFLNSTWNTYENGGAEMIILIWIFAGIWPYIKLFLSLVIWMVPPKYLGVKRRGTVLLWIDALARLSVIDIFTLIIGFAILLVFIGGRDSPSNGDDAYYALKVIVVPKAGIYCIIVAQRISRVSSQFLLEYHENVVNRAVSIRKDIEGNVSISNILTEQQPEENTSLDIDYPSRQMADKDFSDESQAVSESMRVALSQIPTDQSIFKTKSWEIYRWGQLGAILGGVTILIVFIIGCVFVPAIAFDVSTLGGITLESDYTYDEAVSEYGVFLVISGILVKARFVMKTKADYIGLGLLLVAAGVTISSTFVIKVFQFIRKTIQERRNNLDRGPSYGHEGCGLPSYFRLYKWKHMEIYFISVCIGVWQLGSIISYSIHLYCSILTGVFDILTSVGIVEPTEVQCNRVQASLPGNLIITLGSFLILLVTFYLQARGQYKNNLTKASEYVDDKDVPTLSLAWSRDKSKNRRYSHLTESLSLSAIDADTMSLRTGMTPSLGIPPDSPFYRASESFRDSRNRSLSTRSSLRSNQSLHLSAGLSRDTIDEAPNEQDDEVAVPVASALSDDGISRCSDRSSAIDAACEYATPTNNLPETNNMNRSQCYQNVDCRLFAPQTRPEHTSTRTRIEDGLDSSALPRSPAFRSFEDSASVEAPSPPRSPPVTTQSHSRSPPPRFRSTSEFLQHMGENPNGHDS